MMAGRNRPLSVIIGNFPRQISQRHIQLSRNLSEVFSFNAFLAKLTWLVLSLRGRPNFWRRLAGAICSRVLRNPIEGVLLMQSRT